MCIHLANVIQYLEWNVCHKQIIKKIITLIGTYKHYNTSDGHRMEI